MSYGREEPERTQRDHALLSWCFQGAEATGKCESRSHLVGGREERRHTERDKIHSFFILFFHPLPFQLNLLVNASAHPSHCAFHAPFTFPKRSHFGRALDPPQSWVVLVLSPGACGPFAFLSKCQRTRLKREVRSGVMQRIESERDKYLSMEPMQTL